MTKNNILKKITNPEEGALNREGSMVVCPDQITNCTSSRITKLYLKQMDSTWNQRLIIRVINFNSKIKVN